MIEIPPAVDTFVRRLAKAQPSPESIWLNGSRANGGATNESDWDFVVFADAAYFEMLKTGSPPAELAVDGLVVVDASVFRNPWNENKAGDLGRCIGVRRLPPTQPIRARSGFRTKTARKATRLNSGS